MEKLITKIRTESGDLQIDYNALANLPTSDPTLKNPGQFADAEATGNAINTLSSELHGEIDTLASSSSGRMDEFKEEVDNNVKRIDDSISEINSDIIKIESDISTLSNISNTKLSNTGGELSGALSMTNNKIINVATPTSGLDAANKSYVDSKHFTTTSTLSEMWIGSEAPYTQTIDVEGILDTDNPHISPVYSSTANTALLQIESWSLVNKAVTSANTITFYCFNDKPITAIPIQIEVNR